jgi:hypothetical protein
MGRVGIFAARKAALALRAKRGKTKQAKAA